MTARFETSRYQNVLSSSAPTAMDLFSGAGGLSLGFCQAGGRPVAAVDNHSDSIKTYRNIFPICQEVFCGNIEDWRPLATKRAVDVILGGPPCQGFSLARGLRFVDDPRNHLYKYFVRLVDQLHPRWIVMENVPGITSIGKGVVLKQIYEDFNSIGYTLDHKVVNMAEFGVPQTRKRTIFVGNRAHRRFQWPAPTHSPKNHIPLPELIQGPEPAVTIENALSDLPWPLGDYFAHRANSQMRGPRNRYVKTDTAFTLRVRGDEFAFCSEPAIGAFIPGPLPDIELSYSPPNHAFQELMRESPPPWILDHNVMPTIRRQRSSLIGSRRLAIREQARLQTFPDWFDFHGSTYSQSRQIGNAVPPLFARKLFETIIAQM